MKKFSFFAILFLMCTAVGVTACDDDDAGEFDVPEYSTGMKCSELTYKSFCDGDTLVECDDGVIVKKSCGPSLCYWFDTDDLEPDDVAECREPGDTDEYPECTAVGATRQRCVTEKDEAEIVYEKCMSSNHHHAVWVEYKDDADCIGACIDETTCKIK